jgi:hypothetical protein
MTGFLPSKSSFNIYFLIFLLVCGLVLSDITILLKVPPSVGVRKGSMMKLGWKKLIYILSVVVSLP